MRVTARLVLAALVAGSALLSMAPASACDPNRFPNCHTYCGWVAWRYGEISDMSNLKLPPWPRTGVAGCP
jgi:hypothetical protein